ncbi:hypothetical protein DRO56_02090 [Candidatus Bathyarchaeota archaeon]|nr:MAG: hypothetical protein DRO56_02090 [Candidatus Bathyarchaeota archaeon]
MKSRADLREIVGRIPSELYGDLSMDLMDLLLAAKKGDRIPSSSVKELLQLWRRDKLDTPDGISLLLEAALSVDPEGTGRLLASKGLSEVAGKLGLEVS